MATIRLLDAAEADLKEAIGWYRERDEAASGRLERDTEAAFRDIAEAPDSAPLLYGPYRRLILTNFPFSIVYCIDGSEVIVVAVAHAKRRPFYWRRRLGRSTPPQSRKPPRRRRA